MPVGVYPRKFATIEARFWSKVSKSQTCWLWVGNIRKDGYGYFFLRGTTKVLAHRFAYEAMRGKIPPDLHIDHLCRVHNCVNPLHLEIVTRKTNILRGVSPMAKLAARTHCPKGHPFDFTNTIWDNGARRCHICRVLSQRARNRRKRGILPQNYRPYRLAL